MDQHAHHLRILQDQVQACDRHHQRGHPGGPDLDLDGETGDGEPGTPAHGDSAGLSRCPRLLDGQPRQSFDHQGVAHGLRPLQTAKSIDTSLGAVRNRWSRAGRFPRDLTGNCIRDFECQVADVAIFVASSPGF